MGYQKFNFDEFASERYKRLRAQQAEQEAEERRNKTVKNIFWSIKFYVIGVVILYIIRFIIGMILLMAK